MDLYFDDERWAVRYLVVDTRKPMPQRQVLIPAASIERGAAAGGPIRVAFTREQVEKARMPKPIAPFGVSTS